MKRRFMKKAIIYFILLAPLSCFAQFTISGRVLNATDKKPVANVSVFLDNATIGAQTTTDGYFVLRNVKPGKYDLVASDIAFENHYQSLVVSSDNLVLPDIVLTPKVVSLRGVSIKYHVDPNREKYYNLFKDEFLGTSQFAQECRILNPDVLDFDYREADSTLHASSYDFLQVENDALGYRIKYMITDFSMQKEPNSQKKVFYKGPVLFEEMKGRPGQERRWERNRMSVYENSPMHFLRALISNQVAQEGFRVQRLTDFANPNRPPDSVINAKIEFYTGISRRDAAQKDSLDLWKKRSNLPKILQKLMPSPLTQRDMLLSTGQRGKYILTSDDGDLIVGYSSNHHFHINDHLQYLYNPGNDENTLLRFGSSGTFFYSNGVLADPYSIVFYGVWGRNRVAELLPINYEPPQNADTIVQPAGIRVHGSGDSYQRQ